MMFSMFLFGANLELCLKKKSYTISSLARRRAMSEWDGNVKHVNRKSFLPIWAHFRTKQTNSGLKWIIYMNAEVLLSWHLRGPGSNMTMTITLVPSEVCWWHSSVLSLHHCPALQLSAEESDTSWLELNISKAKRMVVSFSRNRWQLLPPWPTLLQMGKSTNTWVSASPISQGSPPTMQFWGSPKRSCTYSGSCDIFLTARKCSWHLITHSLCLQVC